jgi:co-chaperonin GroES (HSP10)
MALRMLRNNIAVIPLEDPGSASSLILRPGTARQRPDQGIVAYRGPDCRQIRAGMHVLFSGYTGTRVVVADEGDFIIMTENDVDLILDEGPLPLFTLQQIIKAADLFFEDDGRDEFISHLETLPTAMMEF